VQFVPDRLFQQRVAQDGRVVLSYAAYQALGTLDGAIDTAAEAARRLPNCPIDHIYGIACHVCTSGVFAAFGGGMAEGGRQIRVFVSSPGDARPERSRLERVAERLNGEFQGVARLITIRWETEFYRAHDTFQAQIPESAQCDIVVAIFRGRLGTELPADFPPMPDGKPYPSGTAYEVLSAIDASKGRGLPDVYVFRFPQPPSVQLEDPNRAEIEDQWNHLKAFFECWFKTSDGQFKAAFQTFVSTDDFEAQVESLLRKWLEEKVLHGRSVVWPVNLKGSPFRGLASFGAKHAVVFFGRNRDLRRAVDKLKDAADKGCPFLLVDGGSGTGKSSLVRAGLVPRLTSSGVVPSVDAWRVAIMRPGELSGDPFAALARALFVRTEDLPGEEEGGPPALPELRASNFKSAAELTALLGHADDTALKPIVGTLAAIEHAIRATDGYDREVKAALLLVVDQLDELFDAQIAADVRTRFAKLLVLLASSGRVWIIATLRADLFERFLNQPELKQLKGDGASYDLAPPDPAELAEIVRGPAAAADLVYETDSTTGERLDERLLKDAGRPDLLPLLQFTLNRLFEARETVDHEIRLTFAAYRALGGLEGAVDKEAEAALQALGEVERARLPRLLRELAAPTQDGSAGRAGYDIRTVLLADAAYDEISAKLVRALTDARILLSTGEGSQATVRLAHARVLDSWQRAQAIVAENADFYRIRAEVEEQRRRWEAAHRSGDLLVGRGRPLAEAESVVRRFPEELPPATRDFIKRSGRRARILQTVTAAAAVLFALVAVGAALAAWQAIVARNAALVAQSQANDARRQADDRRLQAEQGIAAADEILESAGKIEELRGCLAATDRIAAGPPPTASKEFFTGRWHVAHQTSSTYMDWRADGACIFKAVTTGEQSRNLKNATCRWSFEKISDFEFVVNVDENTDLDLINKLKFRIINYNRIHNIDADYDAVRITCPTEERDFYQRELLVRQQLAKTDPGNPERARAVAGIHNRIGDALAAQGKTADALSAYRNAFGITNKLAQDQSANSDLQHDLAASHIRIGDTLAAQGKRPDALEAYRNGLAIMRRLAVDQNNVDWKHDLAVDYNKVGNLLAADRKPADALDAYQQGLTIMKNLADGQPGNAALQFELVLAFYRISRVSDPGAARTALTSALAILEPLERDHKLTDDQQTFPYFLRRDLARLSGSGK
jgi:tetratricopeptide (TPR) repeat protein